MRARRGGLGRSDPPTVSFVSAKGPSVTAGCDPSGRIASLAVRAAGADRGEGCSGMVGGVRQMDRGAGRLGPEAVGA
jgi:hypothetical protein